MNLINIKHVLYSILTIALYILFYFINIGNFIIFFYVISYISLIKYYSSQNVSLNNLFVLFSFFLFLYGLVNPLTQIILFNIDQVYYNSIILYGITIPSLFLGFAFKNNEFKNQLSTPFKSFSVNLQFTFCCLLVILLIYQSYFLYEQGLLLNFQAISEKGRGGIFTDISQLYVVSGFLITSVFLFFIYNYKKLNPLIFLILILLFYYILISIAVGNRRQIIGILLGIFWKYTELKKIKFTFLKLLSFLIFVTIFLVWGFIRDFKGDMSLSNFVDNGLTVNEFSVPYYTLIETLKNDSHTFLYGSTYFINTFLLFIPRFFYSIFSIDKPDTLAINFVNDNFGGGQGYAFMPVTEAYLNFGFIGPILIFMIIGFLFSLVEYKNNLIFRFLLITMSIDFCRTEISTFIYQLFFTGLIFFFFKKINSNNNNNICIN